MCGMCSMMGEVTYVIRAFSFCIYFASRFCSIMLKIRFNRVGRHNRVYYRIVVQEHTAAPGGRHVAVVGSHDPYQKKTILKEDAIKHWLSVGAQPSDTVHNLLVKHQIIVGQKKRPKGKVVVPEPQEEEREDVAEESAEGAEAAEENEPEAEQSAPEVEEKDTEEEVAEKKED